MNHRYVFSGVIFAVLVLAVLFALPKHKASPPSDKPVPTATTIPTAQPLAGSLRVALSGRRFAYATGDTVPFSVLANSAGRNIVGYDIMVKYDPQVIKYTGVTSRRPEFQTIATDRDGVLVVTGTKSLDAKSPTAFGSESIADLKFTAVKTGSVSLTVVYQPGKTNTSNLIDDQNHQILGSAQGTDILVGDSVMVQPKGSARIDDMTVTVSAPELPDPHCNDCFQTRTVTLTRGGESKEVRFNFGGFAGIVQARQSAWGYSFVAEDGVSKGLKLYYAKD